MRTLLQILHILLLLLPFVLLVTFLWQGKYDFAAIAAILVLIYALK